MYIWWGRRLKKRCYYITVDPEMHTSHNRFGVIRFPFIRKPILFKTKNYWSILSFKIVQLWNKIIKWHLCSVIQTRSCDAANVKSTVKEQHQNLESLVFQKERICWKSPTKSPTMTRMWTTQTILVGPKNSIRHNQFLFIIKLKFSYKCNIGTKCGITQRTVNLT